MVGLVGLAWTFHRYYGLLFFLGGALGWWVERKYPASAQEFTCPVASGWIAGESLMGVLLVAGEHGPALSAPCSAADRCGRGSTARRASPGTG
ncbi:MAG: hypothetical protein ACREKS_05700 [Candidatus Rokuibacteriota bacterium]